MISQEINFKVIDACFTLYGIYCGNDTVGAPHRIVSTQNADRNLSHCDAGAVVQRNKWRHDAAVFPPPESELKKNQFSLPCLYYCLWVGIERRYCHV